MAMVCAVVAVLPESTAKFAQHQHCRVAPLRPHFLGKGCQAAAQFLKPAGQLAGGASLGHMGVPAADINKTQVVAAFHQPGNAPGLQFETPGADGVAAGGVHFGGHFAHHLVADCKAGLDIAGQPRALVHGADDAALARVHSWFADSAERRVGHFHIALQNQWQAVCKGHGVAVAQAGGQAIKKT